MSEKILITGGAGFIGVNYASHLLSQGKQVTIYDNLSRKGTPRNIAWLRETYGENSFDLVEEDVRDGNRLVQEVREVGLIIHLAGQVAVTTSVIDPRTDFEINALGTFNVLEAARQSERKPVVIYSSTNTVYGDLEDVRVSEGEDSYFFPDHSDGISEGQLLDFHSPYGCSKGTGDQYVRDYYRIYDLPTIVFRQSCIYGTHQFGIEDQGWVAWFVIAAVTGKSITIYGDGKQVRDLLYVDDLLEAFDLAFKWRNPVLILDTAGRLAIDEELMEQLQRIDRRIEPDQVAFGGCVHVILPPCSARPADRAAAPPLSRPSDPAAPPTAFRSPP